MKNWVIGISGSEMDNVFVERVYGTEEQVKKYLLELVKKDRKADKETWDFGTTSIDGENGIDKRYDGSFYAYGCYWNHHNDYTATPEMEVKILK
jgi:hypothetical protein